MPYTPTSLVFLWVVILALFGLAGSGTVEGTWLLLLVVAALAAPAVILKDRALAPAPARERRPEMR